MGWSLICDYGISWFISGLQIKVRAEKLFFLFLYQNICCGYLKKRLNETALLSTQTRVYIDRYGNKCNLGAQSPYLDLCITFNCHFG